LGSPLAGSIGVFSLDQVFLDGLEHSPEEVFGNFLSLYRQGTRGLKHNKTLANQTSAPISIDI